MIQFPLRAFTSDPLLPLFVHHIFNVSVLSSFLSTCIHFLYPLRTSVPFPPKHAATEDKKLKKK